MIMFSPSETHRSKHWLNIAKHSLNHIQNIILTKTERSSGFDQFKRQDDEARYLALVKSNSKKISLNLLKFGCL